MAWPALPLDPWRDTYATLHMWTQVAGKVVLELTPPTNHYWNIAFKVTSTGLSSHLVPYQNRPFQINFNFLEHRAEVVCSDGRTEALPLRSISVAEFYQEFNELLARLGIEAHIWTQPVEVPNPVKFEEDTLHHTYIPEQAEAFWRVLLAIVPIFEEFRGDFIGKCSPVHFFWGSFDLAVTRFSGRRAPERPGADPITKEAYSHEVISHGFWPGSGPVQEPAFYAYAAPEPAGFGDAAIRPSSAYYHAELKEYVLPYEAVRTSPDPAGELRGFLQSTYAAGADLGNWDRASLEKLRNKSA